jgi:hypothetical protein
MMDGTARTLYVRIGFYVRPTRTLVTQSVLSGVGGRGSALWFGGYGLGVGAEDLGAIPPANVAAVLIHELDTSDDVDEMTRNQIRAWQRTWCPQRT